MDDASRIDITNMVKGILQEGHILLTVNGREIGKVPLDTEKFEMGNGYYMDSHRVYWADDENTLNHTQYVEDCDMGWC